MTDEKKFDDETLGGRLKGYEKSAESVVPYNEFLMVRIDGHKFSKYTKGFVKPFDEILSKTFEKTTIDLVDKFGAVTGYTQSDEITLVFKPTYKEKDGEISNNQIFGGRTQKISSLVAAYTTRQFNKHLEDEVEEWAKPQDEYFSNSFRETSEEDEFRNQRATYMSKIGEAWFDARTFGVPDESEAYNVVMWRVRDAEKNSRSMFAQAYCSHKSLLKKNGVEQVEFCKEETGKDWNEIEDRYKYGILVKKESYQKNIEVKEMGFGDPGETVRRTRITTWAEQLTSFSDDKVTLIVSKLKNELEPA